MPNFLLKAQVEGEPEGNGQLEICLLQCGREKTNIAAVCFRGGIFAVAGAVRIPRN